MTYGADAERFFKFTYSVLRVHQCDALAQVQRTFLRSHHATIWRRYTDHSHLGGVQLESEVRKYLAFAKTINDLMGTLARKVQQSAPEDSTKLRTARVILEDIAACQLQIEKTGAALTEAKRQRGILENQAKDCSVAFNLPGGGKIVKNGVMFIDADSSPHIPVTLLTGKAAQLTRTMLRLVREHAATGGDRGENGATIDDSNELPSCQTQQ